MKKRIIFGILLPVFLFIVQFSEVSSQTNTESRIIMDDLGREVVVKTPIQSVVSLAASNTEILCAIGLCDRIVGVDYSSDYPEEIKDVDKITNFDMSINLEKILSLNPDLVLTAELTSMDQIRSIEALGIPVYYLQNPESIDDLPAHIEKVGKITGQVEEAQIVANELDKRINAVDDLLADCDAGNPSVFYEIDSTDPIKPWTTSSGTFIDNMISKAGGTNVAADLVGLYVQISLEYLMISDPDFIILGDSKAGITADSVAQRTGWNELKAVQNNAVFEFNDDLGSRPGPRLVDGLEQLAKILHPECFSK